MAALAEGDAVAAQHAFELAKWDDSPSGIAAMGVHNDAGFVSHFCTLHTSSPCGLDLAS